VDIKYIFFICLFIFSNQVICMNNAIKENESTDLLEAGKNERLQNNNFTFEEIHHNYLRVLLGDDESVKKFGDASKAKLFFLKKIEEIKCDKELMEERKIFLDILEKSVNYVLRKYAHNNK